MFANTAAASNAAPASLSVIDPCNRTGKIAIPLCHVADTKGVQDYATYQQMVANGVPVPPSQVPKDLSLCLLFQNGRCNTAQRCNQVHAEPNYVAALRQQAMSSSTCCAHHGDVQSAGLNEYPAGSPQATVVVVDEQEERTYRVASFGRTSALDNAMRRAAPTGQSPRVMASRICRLHRTGRCKFGRDCKNVHLCRDAAPLKAHDTAMASSFSLSASTRTVAHNEVKPSARRVPGAAFDHDGSFFTPSSCAESFRSASQCRTSGTVTPQPESDAVSVASSATFAPATVAKPLLATPAKSYSTDTPPPLSAFSTPAKPLHTMFASGAEFCSIRGDPLELTCSTTNGAHSSFLPASVALLDASALTDFDEFVDALEKCKPSPMRSPMTAATQ